MIGAPFFYKGEIVKSRLSLEVDGQNITGEAVADPGQIEVTITSPFSTANFREGEYRWGVAWGMATQHHPERRFVMDGKLTDVGMQLAKQLITNLYLDWTTVSQNKTIIDEQITEAQHQLALLKWKFVDVASPVLKERIEWRRRFKKGEFSQQEYQRSVKMFREKMSVINKEQELARAHICEDFEVWLATNCGRRVKFEKIIRIRQHQHFN